MKKYRKKLEITKWTKDLSISKKRILTKLLNKTKCTLESLGVRVFVVPNYPLDGHYYSLDYAWDVVRDEIGNSYNNRPFIIIVLNIFKNKIHLVDGGLYIQHNCISGVIKKKLISIFKEDFHNKFKWNGKESSALFIKL